MAEQANIRTFVVPPRGSGRLAPTLLEDLTLYDPYRQPIHSHILEGSPLQFANVQQISQLLPHDSCQHAFYIQPRQTKSPELDERPQSTSKYKATAFCRHCRVHMTLTVDYSIREKESPCPTEENPLHHLIFSQHNTNLAAQKFHQKYPAAQSEYFVYECSSTRCSAIVTVMLTPAVLTADVIYTLLDPVLLSERTDEAFAMQKEHLEGMKRPTPLDVLVDLRRYLSNAWDKDQPSFVGDGNKRFAVRFGPNGRACQEALTRMAFVRKADGWQVPTPQRDGEGNVLDSFYNTFLDNLEHELSALILSRPQEERQASQDLTRLEDASKDLSRVLGCQNYDRTPLRTTQMYPSMRPSAFIALGAPQDASDDLVRFAYDRQCSTDPGYLPTYLSALRDVAAERGTETLQLIIAIEESKGRVDVNQLSFAFKALGLSFNAQPDEDHVIGTFESRLQDSPSQEAQLREHLRVIGEGVNSKKLKDYAAKEMTSYQQALDFLTAPEQTDDNFVQLLYATKVSDNPSLQDLAAKAVKIIAQHRKSEALQAFITDGFTAKASSEMDIGDAYNALEIQDRTIDDDVILTVYQMRRSDDGGNADRYTQALRAIAQARESPLLLQELHMAVSPELKLTEPVGLQNIGNTCYLNSLLQFLFTVKDLRNLLLDFERYKMEPDPEMLEIKRVGQRKITVAEVEHGQKFASRLADLFQSMIVTPKTAIRPETELARLTLETDQVKEKIRRRSTLGGVNRPTLGTLDNRVLQGPLPALTQHEDADAERPSLLIPDDIDAVADDDDSTKAVGYSPVDFEPDAIMMRYGDNSSEATLVSRPASEDDVDPEVTAKQQQSIFDNKENLAPGKLTENKDIPAVSVGPLRPASPSKINAQAGALANKTENEVESRTETKPIVYKPPPGPPPIPPRKPIQPSASQLEEYARQQDVTEVINHCLFQLSTAMRPKGFDKSGEQQDEVHELFFGEARMHTDPEGESRSAVPFLNINANVSNRPKDVYAALDNYFDLTETDTGQKSYFSITKLPPILTIALTRVVWDADSKSQKKLEHHVEMPETIYMDRYLETAGESILMQKRRSAWQLKQKLLKLDEKLKLYEEAHAGSKDVAGLFDDAKLALRALSSQIDQDEKYGGPLPIPPDLPAQLGNYAKEIRKKVSEISHEQDVINGTLATGFSDMQQHPYVLHAAFFHRGSPGSGHYWVYIKDQKTGVWRKYNDEYVTIVDNTDDIFKDPNQAGTSTAVPTPYVLVYIRAGPESNSIDELVETVNRNALVESVEEENFLEPLGDSGIWSKAPSQMVEMPPEKVRFQMEASPDWSTSGNSNGGAAIEGIREDLGWDNSEADADPQRWYR